MELIFENCWKICRENLTDEKNGYFIWRPVCGFNHISLSSSYNDKC